MEWNGMAWNGMEYSSAVHDRARILLSAVARHNGLIILENPATSMTWLDPLMAHWVHSVAPFVAQASACCFGTDWAKTWCFVSNKPSISAVAKLCPHGRGAHEQIVGVRLPDGSFKSRLTAEYPAQLAAAVASVIQPFTTRSGQNLRVACWKSMLPTNFSWPTSAGRIEDGGGLCSTAMHMQSRGSGALDSLRKKWFQRLLDSKDCLHIMAKLRAGLSEPPLDDVALRPYMADLLEFLQVDPEDPGLLTVVPGQPFRLSLWQALASKWADPDLALLDILTQGVSSGANEPLLPAAPWPLNEAVPSDTSPLMECTSSWKSALDHLPLVRELVQEEVAAGFVRHVPGGLDELHSRYAKVAVGKLCVVLAEGRSPQLVVDSSVSNVTSNTVIPNRMLLPRISDVVACAPDGVANDNMVQLTLDVSKAHRRVLIRPEDQGLLCFHVGDQLYQCLTLNFGARVSGWYWGRVAGLMIRSAHELLSHSHILWQYVDDLLAWPHRHTAPVWASALVILFLILGIPMSWHKAAISQQIVWIGWSICVESWTVSVPQHKLEVIITQVEALLAAYPPKVKDLQSTLGRLLWLTGAWHHLRPLLIPLYRALCHIPLSMVGVNHQTFATLCETVDESLTFHRALTHLHHSLTAGVQIKRVANTFVDDLKSLQSVYLKARRVWLGIADPDSPNRVLDSDAIEALHSWLDVLQSTSFTVSMRALDTLPVRATADAMASEHEAGLGGVAFFTNGSYVWFQFRISTSEALSVWPWMESNMQKYIAIWELLAQFALTFCIARHIPVSHYPLSCHQGCDNSAADATSAKGITMTRGMSFVLAQYYLFMRREHVYADISHIPGRENVIADALSRFQPSPVELQKSSLCTFCWKDLLNQTGLHNFQSTAKWPVTFRLQPVL